MSYRKYHNRRVKCPEGHMHDSIFEASYCMGLRARLQAGEIKGYSVHVAFDIRVKGVLICRHIVDFLVCRAPGFTEVHETKGVKTAAWSIKHKLFQAIYPEIPYIIIQKSKRRMR